MPTWLPFIPVRCRQEVEGYHLALWGSAWASCRFGVQKKTQKTQRSLKRILIARWWKQMIKIRTALCTYLRRGFDRCDSVTESKLPSFSFVNSASSYIAVEKKQLRHSKVLGRKDGRDERGERREERGEEREQPTDQPTNRATQPTNQPTKQASDQPTNPTDRPSDQPTTTYLNLKLSWEWHGLPKFS